jgi:putative alpha-1,2-mannosidase
LEPFAPVSAGIDFNTPGFIEGSSATYTFYVPQNIHGLIEAIGGNRKFAERLNSNFEKAKPYRFVIPHGQHGYGWVDYENQPSCEMAHLFSHAGMPWKTQDWVRQVKDITFGGITPQDGYNGDEDQGQMGALGVLMAIGLFDIQGCAGENPMLEITSPIFDRIAIKVPSVDQPDKQNIFEIITKKKNASDIYIQKVKLNGKVHNNFRFPVTDFLKGGLLEIELGPKPNTKWGI